MKKIVLATVLAALGSASALAADLAPRAYSKAPMMAAPVSTWQGFYVGGNVGYGWGGDGKTNFTFLPTETAFGDQNTSLNAKPQGVIGGVQIGYNWQADVFVAGFEADIQGSGIKGSATGGLLLFPSLAVDPSQQSKASEKLSWFGTLRGRFGTTITPSLLLYGTGGLAYGQVETTADVAGTDFHFPANASATRTGWTAGAGAEWMFAHNWSVKAEYLYLDLGNVSAVGAKSDNPLSAFAVKYTWHTQDHIVRAGVNYHF